MGIRLHTRGGRRDLKVLKIDNTVFFVFLRSATVHGAMQTGLDYGACVINVRLAFFTFLLIFFLFISDLLFITRSDACAYGEPRTRRQ